MSTNVNEYVYFKDRYNLKYGNKALIEKELSEKKRIIKQIAREKIYAIETEERKQLREIENSYYIEKIEPLDKEISNYKQLIDSFEKYFFLIDCYREKLEKNELLPLPETYKYNYQGEKNFYPILDLIRANELLNLSAFIVDNKKPINRYSLVLIGFSLFPPNLLNKRAYDKHVPCNYNYEKVPNIRMTIKDHSNYKELKSYYLKNKDKILYNLLSEHENLENLYDIAVTEYNKNNNFVLAYLNWKIHYYENNYSHYQENEEYKKLLEERNNL